MQAHRAVCLRRQSGDPIQAFYSIREPQKPLADRRYHNNNSCRVAKPCLPVSAVLAPVITDNVKSALG
jgi:hypothetical protein